ncbi:MAG: glutathione S-transferase [Gammaproteobacteria bacterium]|jgi:GST-like protein|nr:glutathione S-transferase [Gammaproteobacteria bacterium]
MTQYKLYGRENAGSLVVQTALEEIGAPYEFVRVSKDAKDVEAFRPISPTGRVPALALPDGTIMFESAAILVHLSLAHPDAGLAPKPGTSRHALFLQWISFLSANLYEAALRIHYSDRYSARGAADAEAIRSQAAIAFLQHVELVSASLGPYLLGAEYSIADVYLYMLARWYPEGEAQLYARVPALGAHAEVLADRPGLKKAEADHAE